MPLNEAEGYHYSSLTDKQQREAMQNLYGLQKDPHMAPDTAPLTSDELESMRRILAQHDAKTARDSMKEFDLNKPPSPPYIYKEFPFLMYHHATRKTKPAINQIHRDELLAQGWSVDPFPAEGTEIPLTAAEQIEAENIDQRLKKRRA